MVEITIEKMSKVKLEVKEKDFNHHAHWSDNGVMIAKMWKHEPTGEIFYEDVPLVRERGLAIYPF